MNWTGPQASIIGALSKEYIYIYTFTPKFDLEVTHILPSFFHNHLVNYEDSCKGKASLLISSNHRPCALFLQYTGATDMLRIWLFMDFKIWVRKKYSWSYSVIDPISYEFSCVSGLVGVGEWVQETGHGNVWCTDTVPNTYVQIDPRLTPLVVKVITFVDHSSSTSENMKIPPPHPSALALHASFPKFLHA